MLRRQCAFPLDAPGAVSRARPDGRGTVRSRLLPWSYRATGRRLQQQHICPTCCPSFLLNHHSAFSNPLHITMPPRRAVHHHAAPAIATSDEQISNAGAPRILKHNWEGQKTGAPRIPKHTARELQLDRAEHVRKERDTFRSIVIATRAEGLSYFGRRLRRFSPGRPGTTVEAKDFQSGEDDFRDQRRDLADAESPEVSGVRIFCLIVLDAATEVQHLRDDIFKAVHNTTVELKRLVEDRDPAGIPATVFLSRDVAIREDVLVRLVLARLSHARVEYPELSKLCHRYRELVKHTSEDFETLFGPALYESYRKHFVIKNQICSLRDLAKQLAKDVKQDVGLDANRGLDTMLLRHTLSRFAETLKMACPITDTVTDLLFGWAAVDAGGEGLGHMAAVLFCGAHHLGSHESTRLELPNHLRQLTSLFPLSARSSESMAKPFSEIESRVKTLIYRTYRIQQSIKELRIQVFHKAILAGKSGTLEPYAAYIRRDLLNLHKALYRRKHRQTQRKGDLRFLRRGGYKPSKWNLIVLEGVKLRKYLSPDRPQRSLRNIRRAKRHKFIEQLSSPLHVKHYYTNCKRDVTCSHQASGESRRRLHNPRRELRERRRTTLGKARRILSATLLSYQSRTVKTLRSADWVPSLPKMERPSTSTQVGKFITALGFYDESREPNTSIKTNYSRKVNPLEKKSERPVHLTLATTSGFTQTHRMRAAHPTAMLFDTRNLGQSVDMLTDSGAHGPGTTVGDSCASSPSRRDSEYKLPPGDQDPQAPDDQPNEHNPSQPDKDMDKESDEIPPSESEREDEPESEVEEESDTQEAEVQHTPLTYQIPPETLHRALQAPPQTRASYWSQKLYRGPGDEELLLHYCSNIEVSERVAKHFLDEKVLGFDIEWKPFSPAASIKENASLIQLASENRIALFHIARFPGKTVEQLMPLTLKAILESPTILKVGVAVKGDCSRLEKYFDLDIHGVFEISRLHNLVEYHASEPSKVSNKLVSLARQVQQHLLLPLYKGEPLTDEPQKNGSVRESDWSRPLDYEQIQYAAADAYAGLRLFDILEAKRKQLKPTPPIPRVCDYDNKRAPRAAAKTKRARKTKAELKKIATEALSGVDAEDTDEQSYETASEGLAEEDEDADEEADSESSGESDDPDADYVPRRRGRVDVSQRSTDTNAASETTSHHIDRVDFSRLSAANPGYPRLPSVSSTVEDSSSESDAFDPPLKRLKKKKATQEPEALLPKEDESEDKFPDLELEKAFSLMELDPEPLDPRTDAVDRPATSDKPAMNMHDSSASAEPPLHDSGSSAPIHAPTPTFAPLIQLDTSTYTSEFVQATSWAQSYLTSTIPAPSSTATPRIRATVPPLRAYHLWYHQRVPLDAIGSHLRDPPLAQSTVSGYIIQAINMEKLEYRDADLAALMLTLPANLRLGRYGWLSKKLGITR
ncbi:hypothetical protein BU23DRAFT_553675 [Bimuria novae-zelandiae CBS 107.79]|uniref:3'-5' exonuclease domain-containing protein n=1 Tax=Bimuria novae-zelandiae CBS 107.79 TaxID=1447943 RepID=A0A6A5V9C7_9PLEO|nr:hypothetical protein BU23DRAFT_553675 [Bimuria novae-zelandiae CBS 107.79]